MEPRQDPITTDGDVLLCPVCGFSYTHLTGADGRDPDHVTITGYCENGCTFTIGLHQHKGETVLDSDGKRSGQAS
jgi:hypothetical protein